MEIDSSVRGCLEGDLSEILKGYGKAFVNQSLQMDVIQMRLVRYLAYKLPSFEALCTKRLSRTLLLTYDIWALWRIVLCCGGEEGLAEGHLVQDVAEAVHVQAGQTAAGRL